ncbi:MAG: hypothetical protein KF858_00025 [Candidatus Sumerlaeia bacterium]|nr:hypothetical protein [Candidatus Sumerlaeia bacterium]
MAPSESVARSMLVRVAWCLALLLAGAGLLARLSPGLMAASPERLGTAKSSLVIVDTLVDESNGPGNGAGTSLREAIEAVDPGGTIEFAPALNGTIVLTLGTLTIDKSLSIIGPGPGVIAINGNAASRLFRIDAVAVDVELSGLSLLNGASSELYAGCGVHSSSPNARLENMVVSNHRATRFAGAIYNEGGMTLESVAVVGNLAFEGAGAIANLGTMTILDTRIADNGTSVTAGGIFMAGSTMTIRDSIIENNEADVAGGGISVHQGTARIERSILRNNRVFVPGGVGGGIYGLNGEVTNLVLVDTAVEDNRAPFAGGIASDGHLTLFDSTVSGNEAFEGSGGGIYLFDPGAFTTATEVVLVNTTISGNSAETSGGGVQAYPAFGAPFTLRNSTVSANSAGTTGGGLHDRRGAGNTTVHNTIIAGNQAVVGGPDVFSDSGALSSGGGNLIGDDSGSLGFGVAGDLVGTAVSPLDPMLFPLDYYGGRTRTHHPGVGSLAIDNGLSIDVTKKGHRDYLAVAGSEKATSPTLDQRGMPRVIGSAVDIGSVESIASFVVDVTDDADDGNYGVGQLALREAVRYVAPEGTVTFDPVVFGVPQTILFASVAGNDLLVNRPMTIVGPGRTLLTLDGQDGTRFFNVTGEDVTISGMRMTRGRDAFSVSDGGGGAVRCAGSMVLDDVEIDDCHAAGGGAVMNYGSTIIRNSDIHSNTADGFGGGIASSLGSFLRIEDSRIAFNDASLWGSGVHSNALELEVERCLFKENTTVSQDSVYGGAIYIYGWPILPKSTIVDSTFEGNRAEWGGAIQGVGELFVHGSAFVGNEATQWEGGGLSVHGTVLFSNTTIANNTSRRGGGGIASSLVLTLVNCTIVGNRSTLERGGGVYIYSYEEPESTIANSIIALNTSAVGPPDVSIFGDVVTSGGGNLIGDGTGTTIFVAAGDQVGTAADPIDPTLSDLDFFGGPTPTLALLPGSPAIDAGLNVHVNATTMREVSPGTFTDQRGLPANRIVNGTVDIGAFETGDFDGDGIPDLVENSVPSRSARWADGNGDGVNDSIQPKVRSARNPVTQHFVTLDFSAAESVVSSDLIDEPAHSGEVDPDDFPRGWYTFAITVPAAGGSTTVDIYHESDPGLQSTLGYGPTPAIPSAHLYDFNFAGGIGATYPGFPTDMSRIRLTVRDGAAGDHDLDAANATIVHVGAQGVSSTTLAHVVAFEATAPVAGAPITIRWETAAEIDTIGFHLHRAELVGGTFLRGERVNVAIIPAEGTETSGAVYQFMDYAPLYAEGEAQAYFLEDLDVHGKSGRHGPAIVTIKSTDTSVLEWTLY